VSVSPIVARKTWRWLALWHAQSLLREFRGDIQVAALCSEATTSRSDDEAALAPPYEVAAAALSVATAS
jgi:hypothetical protein